MLNAFLGFVVLGLLAAIWMKLLALEQQVQALKASVDALPK